MEKVALNGFLEMFADEFCDTSCQGASGGSVLWRGARQNRKTTQRPEQAASQHARFGHSMVVNNTLLNRHRNVDLTYYAKDTREKHLHYS